MKTLARASRALRTSVLTSAAAVGLFGLDVHYAGAVPRTWIGTSGTWTDSSRWSPNGIPWQDEVAYVNAAHGQFLSIQYVQPVGPLGTLAGLNLSSDDSTGVSNITVNSGTLATRGTFVGQWGSSQFQLSGNGTHTATGDLDGLVVGWDRAANGSYFMDNGTLATSRTIVGSAGTGYFKQELGRHTTGLLSVAGDAFGVGTYTIWGGLTQATSTRVGDAGFGTMNVRGGQVSGQDFDVAFSAGTRGTVFQDNGAVSINNNLRVARSATSVGTYTMNWGNLGAGAITVGENGAGTFLYGGGTINTASLKLGQNAGAVGYLQLGGSANGWANAMTVGVLGAGTVNHFTGSFGTGQLNIGANPGSTGWYEMLTGSLEATRVNVGTGGGTARLVQRGGTFTGGTLSVASTAQYIMNGGTTTLGTVNNDGSIIINGGRAAFDDFRGAAGTLHVGGTATMTANGVWTKFLSLGDGAGAGTITLRSNQPMTSRIDQMTFTLMGGNYLAALDLNDNDLIVTGHDVTAMHNVMNKSYHNGAWDRGGIISSAAKADRAKSIGLMSGAEYKAIRGSSNATFNGWAVADSDSLFKFTWAGDANFDGRVTFDDYAKIDTGFNQRRTGWSNGDFNYSGSVSFDDYVLIDIAFNQQNGTLGRALEMLNGGSQGSEAAAPVQAVIDHARQFGAPYAQAFTAAAVPEPSCITATVLSGLAMSWRRRRGAR